MMEAQKTWKTSYQEIKAAIRNLQTFSEMGAIPEELINLNIIYLNLAFIFLGLFRLINFMVCYF